MAFISLLVSFILGVVAVIAVEVAGILYVLCRLTAKTESKAGSPGNVSGSGDQIDSSYKKQGTVWVLEPEKVPKIPLPGERNRKKEILEVSPVQKFAKIKDRSLILTDPDGSYAVVLLKGCRVLAVSATSLPLRKWAKRYPIKIESKTTVLYNNSKLLYIYVETSSDKESWCKALRLASCEEKETLDWFFKVNEEFHEYIKSLVGGHPSLIKPSVSLDMGPSYKDSRNDLPSSKVRIFWRKLSKKATKSSSENKFVPAVEKSRSVQDGSAKQAFKGMLSSASTEDCSIPAPSGAGSQSNASEISDSDVDEKTLIDEGSLCWNLLVSRLFFDAKGNVDIKSSLKARIQRSLSNMRIPSYVGEVTCTDIDPGCFPPYIHSMRAIPTNMNDVWAIEMDVEYSGGMVLYVESRLEVRELDVLGGTTTSTMESNSDRELTAHLLEGFEHLREELNLSSTTMESRQQKDLEDTQVDRIKSIRSNTSSSNSESKWKSIINSVAKQVNQVSFSLAIRVASLRGTLQFHIKPPPSDQLWVGFSSMPDIDFHLEPSVGDHKLPSTRIALFLVNRFKAAIRETLVLPNCESVTVPFMLAEKEDWVPRTVAPFIWVRREGPSNPKPVPRAVADHQDTRESKVKRLDPTREHLELSSSSEIQETSSQQTREEIMVCPSPSRYVSLKEERSVIGDEDDGKAKKPGKRVKMLELAKKMSEKIEEKKHHINEKSRLIVEKMRTPSTSSTTTSSS